MNWGPGAAGGFQNALSLGMQMGQMANQQRQQNALMQQREQALAIQARDQQMQEQRAAQQQQAAAMEQRNEQLGTVRQLLKVAGTDPMRALQAAQSMGIDTSAFPQPGTAEFEPWRQQQLFIADALSDPAQVDQLDRDLARLGYPEGSPGRDAAARELILFRYGKPVTTADGRAAIEMPQIGMPQGAAPQPTVENTPAPQLGPNGMPTMLTRDQYQAVEQRMGKAETQAWAQRNGIKVVARTGTDASGRRVVQYTDGTIDYAD